MKISISIMASPARKEHAEALYEMVKSMPFSSSTIIWDEHSDEWETGERGLRWHTDSDFSCQIQDDAIISRHFYENVKSAIENAPYETLISFYTGTVRPRPTQVLEAVRMAQETGSSFIQGVRLWWGVGFAIPTKQIIPMLDFVKNYKTMKYDDRIGSYYAQTGLGVLYTFPSLVNHNYLIGSLIGNDHANTEPRVAHKYVGELVSFNGKMVVMKKEAYDV